MHLVLDLDLINCLQWLQIQNQGTDVPKNVSSLTEIIDHGNGTSANPVAGRFKLEVCNWLINLYSIQQN